MVHIFLLSFLRVKATWILLLQSTKKNLNYLAYDCCETFCIYQLNKLQLTVTDHACKIYTDIVSSVQLASDAALYLLTWQRAHPPFIIFVCARELAKQHAALMMMATELFCSKAKGNIV